MAEAMGGRPAKTDERRGQELRQKEKKKSIQLGEAGVSYARG